jgi:hypothetical protein
MTESSSNAQVRLNRVSASYWRVVMNKPTPQSHGASVCSGEDGIALAAIKVLHSRR